MFRDLIGKPFKDMGRGPDAYDCWGICIEVSKRLRQHLPDYGDIHFDAYSEIIERYVSGQQDFQRVTKPRAGDIVVFKRTDGGLHFGIMISNYEFLHTTQHGVAGGRVDHPFNRQLIREFQRCKNQ